jgi:ubiquinone/menaquinone biosynthesis C-methylase UbiE
MAPLPPPSADPAMQAYYAARAREYELIYAKPERQADLRILEADIPVYFAGRSVIEVACGTGYWTQHIARTASRILATDLTEETLQVARAKNLPQAQVRYQVSDAYDLPASQGPFDGAFAGFWWSHLRRAQRKEFLASLWRCMAPGATVVLLDNLYVEGSSTPIARRDAAGDTWQVRKLGDGTTHEVLKNFPTEAELRADVEGFGTNCRYRALQYYWLFTFETA